MFRRFHSRRIIHKAFQRPVYELLLVICPQPVPKSRFGRCIYLGLDDHGHDHDHDDGGYDDDDDDDGDDDGDDDEDGVRIYD